MITKRQLGWFLIALGLGGDLLLLIVGRLGAGEWSGIGPFERTLLLGGVALAALGLPLLRGNDGPAARAVEPDYRSARSPGVGREGAQAALNPAWTWAARILQGLVLLAFLAYFAVYITYALDLFRWPYDYDQGESFELYDAVLHSRGEWPYRDSSTYPFYASNYPPVFHLLNILLFPLFGPTLLSGRVLSFSITLLTALAIGLTVRRRTGGVFIPGISGLAYLASSFVYRIGPLCRQHLLMVLLETLSVFFIAAAADSPFGSTRTGRRNLLLGLGCLFLAAYSKQLAIFTAVAVFGHLFLPRPLRAVGAAALFGVAFAAVFLALNWATGGYWWINTISANVNAYMLPQLIGLARSWLSIHTLFIVLACGMIAYEVYVDRLSIYSLWFPAALLTGVMSGKWGAGEAYWVTSVAAAIILTGFALGGVRTWVAQHRPAWRGAVAVLVPAMLLAQTPRMLHLPTEGAIWGPVARVLGVAGRSVYADYPYYDTVGYTQLGHLMLPRDYEAGQRIMDYVRASEGPVFSEEAAFTMLGDKPVITNPTQMLNLYNNGLLDTTELEAMIRAQAFGLVIMRAQFYPPPVLAAIGGHYELVEHIAMNGFDYIIMKPAGQPSEP